MTAFRIFARRTTGSGPPSDLEFGEIAFSDADDSLHVGKADGTPHTVGNSPGTGTTQPGPKGDSAYQVWLDAGNTGTVADFFESLRGPEGDPGNDARIPPGAVMWCAMTVPPTGWLKANGAALSRPAYVDLFAVIGVTYGNGDGSSTFNLPDLRGEFLRGWDDGRGVDVGRGLGTPQADEFKAHTHTTRVDLGTNADPHNVSGAQVPGSGGSEDTTGAPLHNSGGVETRPRNVALLAIIKY